MSAVPKFTQAAASRIDEAVNDDAIRAPRPLPPDLLPVPPFPLRALPDAFGAFVEDVAERMQCPPDFVAVPMLVAA